MPNNFELKKLRFIVMPTRFPSESHREDYLAAYKCWKDVWENAFTTEMNVHEPLYSDYFSRQSHLAVLFYDKDPVGLVTLNLFDLNDRVNLDDSFFKIWPDTSLFKLKKDARIVMTCCNVTLNYKYRKNAFGIAGKDLLFSFLVRFLKSTQLDAIVSAVRLEKGMERAAYRTGASPLCKNLAYTIPGQRVDLVYWHKSLDEQLIDPSLRQITQFVFKNSFDIPHELNIIQGVKHVA